MTIWYRKSRWSDKIQEVEVVKTTPMSIWYTEEVPFRMDGAKNPIMRRRMERRGTGEWFETKRALLEYACDEAQKRAGYAADELKEADEAYAKASKALAKCAKT